MAEIDDDRCEHLRWKGLYMNSEVDSDYSYPADRLFWCHKTQQCIGPDGKVVDDYECNPTRGCYRGL